MGPRRQLGLSISFVDDDAVMGEGKGSPLGIAAIALVGDDATAPSRSVAVVTPPSDERWAEPLWSAAEKRRSTICEADALLPKELLVRVLALLNRKEVAAPVFPQPSSEPSLASSSFSSGPSLSSHYSAAACAYFVRRAPPCDRRGPRSPPANPPCKA